MTVINKIRILFILIIGLHMCGGQFGLDRLEAQLSNALQNSINSFDNFFELEDTFTQKIYESLRPVRIFESVMKVLQGIGGTTIATFSPHIKKFIIHNGIFYECINGWISDDDGYCYGTLRQFSFDKKQDFCYTSWKTVIGDEWYCLSGSSGGISTSVVNGKIYCNGGRDTLLISAAEYKSLCENIARNVLYKYFTNNYIQETGNGLQCTSRADAPQQICTFSAAVFNDGSADTINY